MACLSLGLTGCALFGKKSGEADRPAPAPVGKTPSKFPTGDPLFPGTARTTENSVLLAGRVVDNFNNRPTNAYIRYVCLEEGKEPAAPIEVASTDGYFTIPGLKPGATYKLMARTQQGERLMAGVTYTTAPNPRVVIRLSEEQAGATTPPIPTAPAFQGNKDPSSSSQDSMKAPVVFPAEQPASAQVPAWGPTHPVPPAAPVSEASLGGPAPLEPAPPVQMNVPTPGSPPAPPSWVPGLPVADRAAWSPTVDVPGQAPRPLPAVHNAPSMNAAAVSGDSRARGLGPARVPSCALVGKQLVNLALHDVHGEPWEFKTNRRGRLILLDFWGTHCPPCREGMPYLRDLNNKYGPSGLEVVGIAYELAGSPREQGARVTAVSRKMETNYRQLLGSGGQCPVRDQFKIRILPTHVLIDQNGWIVWRHEGRMGELDREQLEVIIRRRLANQQ
jgi:thiol-disulfide isomerase/thioredoxin